MDEILFRDRYRIPSIRLKTWDYGGSGWYFITICANGKQPFFGKIEHGAMRLSEIGQIAVDELIKTPTIRPYVDLDEWIVMPDHIHAIIAVKRRDIGDLVETPCQGVSTYAPTIPNHWAVGTLGAIVNQYKRACTMRIRKIEPDFTWQSRYYDRIIRNDDELDAIREYIRNNPLKDAIRQ